MLNTRRDNGIICKRMLTKRGASTGFLQDATSITATNADAYAADTKQRKT